MPVRNIYLYFFFQRQRLVPVFQKHNGMQLGIKALLDKFRISHCIQRFLQLQVGIFKQSGTENIFQQPHCRTFETFPHGFFTIFFTAHTICFKDRLDIIVAAELIHTRLQRLQVPLLYRKLFHAPAFSGEFFFGFPVLWVIPQSVQTTPSYPSCSRSRFPIR